MSTEGWIFMVGLRVFDVGALIVWLVWFFRLREEDDDDDGDDSGGGNDRNGTPKAPGGDGIPLPDADPWPQRRRDHAGDRPPATAPARRVPARPEREPVRYRRSSWPA
jgi:hypothetical protein